MKKFLFSALVLFPVFTVCQSAHAVLVLNIDLITEELFLTGSDTGSALETVFGSGAQWQGQALDIRLGAQHGSTIDLISGLDAGSAFTSFILFEGASRDPNTGISKVAFSLSAEADSGNETTLVGNGNRISYAESSEAIKESIEAMAMVPDYTFNLSQGSDFTPITIAVAQVPEPSASALFAMVALMIAGCRRRRS